jgi:hypothetical protein
MDTLGPTLAAEAERYRKQALREARRRRYQQRKADYWKQRALAAEWHDRQQGTA